MSANPKPIWPGMLGWILGVAWLAAALAPVTAAQAAPAAAQTGVAKLLPIPVEFETEDKVTIVGRMLLPPRAGGPWPCAVLLPMLGHSKDTFGDLMITLALNGWASLAVDLRGHGESVKQGIRTLDADRFRPGTDFINMRLDAIAAFRFAASHETVLPDQIAVVGAGIGANAAVQAIQQFHRSSDTNNPQIAAVVLLSPGETYRGIQCKAADLVALEQTPLFLCASHDDLFSFNTVESYSSIYQFNRNMDTYFLQDAGHGTAMFTGNRHLKTKVAEWLVENIGRDKSAAN